MRSLKNYVFLFIIATVGCTKKETAIVAPDVNPAAKLQTSAEPLRSATWSIDYVSGISYKLTGYLDGQERSFSLYRNGVLYDNNLNSSPSITEDLTPGNYYAKFQYYDSFGLQTVYAPTVKISAQPTSPAGMMCLYRYFSSKYSAHFYTTDWSELGSSKDGYIFEKVTAYVYPNGTAGYAPLYRYYSPNYADHYYTTTFGTYPMYNYEWIQCTVATTSTGVMTNALNQYYNPTLADHFYCIAPETPTGTGWVYEKVACYVQTPQ